jgi:hypothetical protein
LSATLPIRVQVNVGRVPSGCRPWPTIWPGWLKDTQTLDYQHVCKGDFLK